jgi:hypothetical protein
MAGMSTRRCRLKLTGRASLVAWFLCLVLALVPMTIVIEAAIPGLAEAQTLKRFIKKTDRAMRRSARRVRRALSGRSYSRRSRPRNSRRHSQVRQRKTAGQFSRQDPRVDEKSENAASRSLPEEDVPVNVSPSEETEERLVVVPPMPTRQPRLRGATHREMDVAVYTKFYRDGVVEGRPLSREPTRQARMASMSWIANLLQTLRKIQTASDDRGFQDDHGEAGAALMP